MSHHLTDFFYTKNMPIFVHARKDAVLTKQSRSLIKPWIASTTAWSRNDDLKKCQGASVKVKKSCHIRKRCLPEGF
jgi:hypothetical protein